MIDNWINEESGWIIKFIESQYNFSIESQFQLIDDYQEVLI